MPHQVEHLSYAKFCDRDVPWWGTGISSKETAIEGRYLSIEEAKANFPWMVELRPTYQIREYDNQFSYHQIPNSHSVTLVHDDIFHPDHQMVLGVVGSQYVVEPQPHELIDFGAEMVDNHGFIFDTVGDLRNHRVIFASMKITALDGVEVGSSASGLVDHDLYLLLTNYFDGQGSLRADVVPIRTVCNNTLQLALKGTKSSWKIRHVGRPTARATEARDALGIVTAYQKEYARTVEQLATSEFNIDQFKAFAGEMMSYDESMPRRAVKAEEAQQELIANFLHSPTISEDWRFTKWGALNAFTEWNEWIHDRRVDYRTAPKDKRMLTVLLGGPAAVQRQKAYDKLVRV